MTGNFDASWDDSGNGSKLISLFMSPGSSASAPDAGTDVGCEIMH